MRMSALWLFAGYLLSFACLVMMHEGAHAAIFLDNGCAGIGFSVFPKYGLVGTRCLSWPADTPADAFRQTALLQSFNEIAGYSLMALLTVAYLGCLFFRLEDAR